MANITGTLGRIAALVGLQKIWRESREHGQTGRLILFALLGAAAAAVGTLYTEHKAEGHKYSEQYPKLTA